MNVEIVHLKESQRMGKYYKLKSSENLQIVQTQKINTWRRDGSDKKAKACKKWNNKNFEARWNWRAEKNLYIKNEV